MRRFAALLLTLGFVLAFPTLASAHDVLQKTTPADGATVQRMPSKISLQLAEPPLALGTQVIVKGPAGDVATGKAIIEGNIVVQAVSATAPAGRYTVTFRVTSDDGHPVSGTFSFQASAGGASTSTGPATSTGPSTSTPASTPATSSQPPTSTSPSSSATTVAAAPAVTPVATEGSSFVPLLLVVVGILVAVGLGGFFVLRRRQQP